MAAKAAAAPSKKVVKFVKERETKGAVVYCEVNEQFPTLDKAKDAAMDDFVVGSLYLRKKAIAGEAPKELTVTIEG